VPICLLAFLLARCGEPMATPEPVYLGAAGSMTMTPLIADLAEAFRERSPHIELGVVGLGTRFGLQALRSGEADLALASWLPPEPGDQADLTEASGGAAALSGLMLDPNWRASAIARDGVAIIVHPSNPVRGVGLLQLKDLFSGRAYEWSAVGGPESQGQVQPVSREAGSGSRAAFEVLVMEEMPVTPRAVLVPSAQGVVDYVAEHPQSIGYVSMALVTREVKVLQIEGELPTPSSVGQGIYPLSRELWMVATESPPESVEEFLEFALSPAGQQIVGQRYGRLR
jgi:phosphate transport system substrate-binding protein